MWNLSFYKNFSARIRGVISGKEVKSNSKIFILHGPPGVGKTRRAEEYARVHGAALVFYQCHAWTDADELFAGVDVRAAVAGDVDNVRQPGVLAVAAEKSHSGLVVLVLDELDKTSDKAEALLLDFLQSGRVPLAPGVHVRANMDNLVVFITTNGVREFSEALLRRGRRVWMQPLPVEEQVKIIAERAGCSESLARVAWKAARWVAEQEGNSALSMQEGWNIVLELLEGEPTKQAVISALQGWAARTEAGAIEAINCPMIPAIVGELKKIKK